MNASQEFQLPEGVKVEVVHIRRCKVAGTGSIRLLTVKQARAEGIANVLSTGGFTHAAIIGPGGTVIAEGQADCAATDQFDRRVGRQLAIRRAFDNADVKGRGGPRALRVSDASDDGLR